MRDALNAAELFFFNDADIVWCLEVRRNDAN